MSSSSGPRSFFVEKGGRGRTHRVVLDLVLVELLELLGRSRLVLFKRRYRTEGFQWSESAGCEESEDCSVRTLSAVPVLARHIRSLGLPLLVIERVAQERVVGIDIRS